MLYQLENVSVANTVTRRFVKFTMEPVRGITSGTDTSFCLLDDDYGINYGTVPGNLSTYTWPGQHGNSVSSVKLEPREIAFTGYAYYWLTDEEKRERRSERERIAREGLEKKKWLLDAVFTPLNEISVLFTFVKENEDGTKTRKQWKISGYPVSSVAYGQAVSENNSAFCKFTCSLLCNNPLFSGDSVTASVSRPGPTVTVTTRYPNAVPWGAVFRISVTSGSVLNPVVVVSHPFYQGYANVMHKMNVKMTLTAGDSLVINTIDGQRGVYKTWTDSSGTHKEDCLKYWDFDNKWVQLQGGDIIGLGVGNPDGGNVSLTVSMEQHVYSLEGFMI